MSLITTTEELAQFCQSVAGAEFVTVDTEFMREKTYWPQLCLVQVAGPDSAVAIDPLADGLDLAPLIELLANPGVLKVFHAARQDVEIFFHLSGKIPAPLFDTQVAAMVCGFGDSVSYETLVAKLANARIDKTSRFTDWSHRPLTERQLTYALSDVVHLRPAYEKLKKRLTSTGREHWLSEEMAVLTDPETYRLEPQESWRRLKVRSDKPRFLAVLREVAAWREREAQKKDIPRSRVLRDEALVEIAAHAPANVDELARTRGFGRSMAEGRYGTELLAAVARAKTVPDSDLPRVAPRADLPQGIAPIVELLRVLLRMSCEDHDVASRLVANAADLELLAASDEADVPALKGWRREVFGNAALDLKHGRLGLAIGGRKVRLVDLRAAAPERQSAE